MGDNETGETQPPARPTGITGPAGRGCPSHLAPAVLAVVLLLVVAPLVPREQPPAALLLDGRLEHGAQHINAH
jgi:hypothetical protein